jgi:uncharacterized membrane protein YtjA (UPF0391 family)
MMNIIFATICAFGGYKIWQGTSSLTARIMMYVFLCFVILSWFQT